MNKKILAILLLFCILLITSCGYVDQNQVGFKYNLSSGKSVAPANNPQLKFGWYGKGLWPFNINDRWFVINHEVNRYSFTEDRQSGTSPYNEALSWDSIEGVTMEVNYTIEGRVTDPWEFYSHYGTPQGSYGRIEGIKDNKIYEALRHAGLYADIMMGEITQDKAATDIRKNPGEYYEKLTELCSNFCEEYGFEITRIIFPDAFIFPSGNVIEEARDKLREANTKYEELLKEKRNADAEKDKLMAQAKIDAKKILGEGQREANMLKTEANAIAMEMQTLIRRVGVQGAMRLKMTELLGVLIEHGVIDKAYLTKDSIFGEPFYKY